MIRSECFTCNFHSWSLNSCLFDMILRISGPQIVGSVSGLILEPNRVDYQRSGTRLIELTRNEKKKN